MASMHHSSYAVDEESTIDDASGVLGKSPLLEQYYQMEEIWCGGDAILTPGLIL